MNTLLYLMLEQSKNTEEKKWYLELIKKIGKELVDLWKGFMDFFILIKKNTYDVLVEKYGYVGVSLAFAAIITILIMVVVTKVIRGNGE